MKKNSPETEQESKHPLEHLYRFLSACNPRCLFAIARGLSYVISHTDNRISRQTTQNIELCFPDFTPRQQKQLIRESIFHTCCAFTELANIWNQDINKVLDKITVKHIDPSFQSSNKPSIIIAPHHGSWELMNYWLASQEALYALYKPARKKNLDNYIYRKRTRNGATLVATNTAGIRKLLRGMKEGANCMILPDQRPGKKTASEISSFFSNPVQTSLLIKNLANKVDCNIYIGAITREISKGEYHLNLVRVDRSKIVDTDKDSANYLNETIQNFVSHRICQYQWSYRRFTDSAYNQV